MEIMKTSVRAFTERIDKAIVASVALVFTLTLLTSVWQGAPVPAAGSLGETEKLSKVTATSAAVVDVPEISAATDVSFGTAEEHHQETDPSSKGDVEPQASELEVDVAHEEACLYVLLPLETRQSSPMSLEPEQPQSQRLKRPPRPAV